MGLMSEVKSCKICSATFEITDEDFKFFERISPVINGKNYTVNPPTLCPECRYLRRYAFRNERSLYTRKCDLCKQHKIFLFSPDKPHVTYCQPCWQSDLWDPMDYGRDYDFSKTFFDQYLELKLQIPQRGMQQDGTLENCEYCSYGGNSKNCYLAFTSLYSEDVYYANCCLLSKNIVDCTECIETELCYECVYCRKCYNLAYSNDCVGCRDSYLLENCQNCSNCIACKNLRNKEYHIYNKPVSKEEFEAFKKNLLESGIKKEKEKFGKWKLQLPYLYGHFVNVENSTGDYLEGTKNCINCFEVVLNTQDCKHSQYSGWNSRDMMDVTSCGKNAELMYETQGADELYHSAFVNFARTSHDCYCCEGIMSCENCFGCYGLKHKKYCILNKQYTKEQYEEILPKIIEKMKKDGEWGEYFPYQLSPFGYNETISQEFVPLTREEALKRGFNWSDYENPKPKISNILKARELPKIQDTTDEILNAAIECEITGKPFKIIRQELEFYKKQGLSLPTKHPDQRHKERIATKNPYKLWDRNCAKCGLAIKTAYAPDRPEIIYCEKCYLEAVY